jgi:hypothetical protein
MNNGMVEKQQWRSQIACPRDPYSKSHSTSTEEKINPNLLFCPELSLQDT